MVKWIIAISLLVYTLVEIALLQWVESIVGLGWLLAWTVFSALLGIVMLRVEGIRGILRIHRQLQQEVLPTRELIDMALIVLGAMLLVAPGILSDAVGILLLIPPTRWGLRVLVRRTLGIQLLRDPAVRKPSQEVIEVEPQHVQD